MNLIGQVVLGIVLINAFVLIALYFLSRREAPGLESRMNSSAPCGMQPLHPGKQEQPRPRRPEHQKQDGGWDMSDGEFGI